LAKAGSQHRGTDQAAVPGASLTVPHSVVFDFEEDPNVDPEPINIDFDIIKERSNFKAFNYTPASLVELIGKHFILSVLGNADTIYYSHCLFSFDELRC
jgi:hypothetical protein